MPLRLVVVTPASPVLDESVDGVTAPGSEGEFGVLPGHERFLCPLQEGVLEYAQGGQVGKLRLGGGFAEIQPDCVTVLADSAERL